MYTVVIDGLRFEWDESKDRLNQQTHEITFNEAATAFFDVFGRIIPDPEHSGAEERLILLGRSGLLTVLVVIHTWRQHDEVIRLISARRACRSERRQYAEGLG